MANAFGTSVGARTLTLAQACIVSASGGGGGGGGGERVTVGEHASHCVMSVHPHRLVMRPCPLLQVASIFEFGGAVLLGGEVTQTVDNSIARPDSFSSNPAEFMYGMLCSLCAASLWVYAATYMGLAVSTTHSIGMCSQGCECQS